METNVTFTCLSKFATGLRQASLSRLQVVFYGCKCVRVPCLSCEINVVFGFFFYLLFFIFFIHILTTFCRCLIYALLVCFGGGILKNRFYFLNVSHSLLDTTKTDSSAPRLYKSKIIACKVSLCGYI